MADEPLEQEVIEEHRRLDALFSAVRGVFIAKRGSRALAASLSRLHEALEVHVLQEEELYYPVLWSLRPHQKATLEACVAMHQRFRELLHDLDGRTTRGELAGAVQVFEALAEDFRRHEVREEGLLHELERELAGTG